MNMKAAGIRKALYSLGAEPLTIPMVRGRSLIHMGEGHLMLKIDHTQKKSLILAQNER